MNNLNIFNELRFFSRNLLTGLTVVLLCSVISITSAQAKTITVTDIAGRTVEVKEGVKRVILGEGRMMYSVAIIEKNAPFKHIVGWKDDLIKYDPDAFRQYRSKFPKEVEKIKNFGSPYAGDFSVESAIDLKTDLVILNLGNLYKARETGVIEKLEKAGIKVIFIDFRINPTHNTVPSMYLLGRVFDQLDNAQEFIDFYMQQMRRVTTVAAKIPDEDRPMVFLETAAGYSNSCCRTFGHTNLGELISIAGGKNWGSTKTFGLHFATSLESIISLNPDIIIGTGANWKEANPEVASVLLGYDATQASVDERLQGLADRKGWHTLDAVKNKHFHTIYHQFYNSPYHFVALQVFAKWIHPERFKDLDPEATFAETHERFLPFNLKGIFWSTLD